MDDIAAQAHALAHVHYPDYANPELLEKIPLNARTLLDIGCAQGALGAAYLRRNPTARYLGIELDAEAAAHASARLTEVVCADTETNVMPFAVPDGIDCIIYGDVLEHLRDPWELLRQHTQFLAPDGTVLVCMPNMEHWSITLKLLNGSFNYEDVGLLDRTHLRWFTPRTMADAMIEAGLELADAGPRPTSQANIDYALKFTQAMTPGLQAIGVDPAEYLNRCGPLQFIWRARKSAPKRVAISATMLEPLGGVSDVRVVEPIRALRTDSNVFGEILAEGDLRPVLKDCPQIVVLHRPLLLGDSGLERLKRLLRQGYLVVSEFDDHPIFMQQRGVPVDELWTFRGVHAIQTSTPALAEVLRGENPEVAMFPNGIFELPAIVNFADQDQLTLFFGALNRSEDWAPFMPALNEVARAVGSRLKFSVAHDRKFFDALETPHKIFTPTCDYPTYLKLLGQADIAFMPLADTIFNRAKSDLKFIEAAACRVVSLASDVVYQDSIENSKTGLIFRNDVEMRGHLLRVLAYPEAARKMADAARAHVAAHRMLAYQTADRLKWYRSLWERRDELNKALQARLPALFT